MQLSAQFTIFMILDPANKKMKVLNIVLTLWTIVTGLAIQRADYGKMQLVSEKLH